MKKFAKNRRLVWPFLSLAIPCLVLFFVFSVGWAQSGKPAELNYGPQKAPSHEQQTLAGLPQDG
jgi:hypothetical protein